MCCCIVLAYSISVGIRIVVRIMDRNKNEVRVSVEFQFGIMVTDCQDSNSVIFRSNICQMLFIPGMLNSVLFTILISITTIRISFKIQILSLRSVVQCRGQCFTLPSCLTPPCPLLTCHCECLHKFINQSSNIQTLFKIPSSLVSESIRVPWHDVYVKHRSWVHVEKTRGRRQAERHHRRGWREMVDQIRDDFHDIRNDVWTQQRVRRNNSRWQESPGKRQ